MGTPTTAGIVGGSAAKLPNWRDWRDWVTPKRFWWGLAIVVLGIAGIFGGLDTVNPRAKYIELKAGQTFRGAQFDVTVLSARRELLGWGTNAGLNAPGRQPPPAGQAYLVVEADIKNVTAESDNVQDRSGVDGKGPGLMQVGPTRDKLINVSVMRADYPAQSRLVQPGQTTRMAFVTSGPTDKVRVGGPVVVQINDFEYVPRTGPQEGYEWKASDKHGVYHLTIEDNR